MIFSKKNKILAIFCHPDDPELVCYGTLRKMKSMGSKIFILILTRGEKSKSSNTTSRINFSKKALANISNHLFFESLEDGQITYNSESVSLIDFYLNKIKPDILLTHFTNLDGSSSHQDHHNTRLIVTNSGRRSIYVKHLILSEPEYNIKEFIPNLYVDITKYFNEKTKILKFHKKENLKYYFQKNYLVTKSDWWAMQIDHFNKKPKKYFETFQIIFTKN